MLENNNPSTGKYHKTIAIIARPNEAEILMELNKAIVTIGSDHFNYKYDFDHPNAIYIIHKNLKIANNISRCFGSDIIVKIEHEMIYVDLITENSQESSFCQKITTKDISKVLTDIAKKILELATEWENNESCNAPRLKNVNPPENNSRSTLSQEIIKSLSSNKEFRSKQILKVFGKKIFDAEIGILILGGAGPAASADFTIKFVKHLKKKQISENFIHLSLNQCPGKSKHISGNAPPFQQYYIDTVDFANRLKVRQIVTPCNTNHIVLDGWSKTFSGKILDYRNALLSKLKKDNIQEILILGTRSTIFDHKLYHKIIEEAGIKVETVGEKERCDIDKAISKIKAGNFLDSKKSINKVIENYKSKHGKNITTVLACTELPLVYSKQELMDNNLVCVSMSAIDYFTKKTVDENL